MIVMPPAGGGEVGGPPAVLEKKRKAAQPPPTPDEIADLPAPVGPTPTLREVVDLPTPKRPSGALPRPPEIPDLPVPVGPLPTKGIVDLPVPVGPLPTKGIVDLPTPVGPLPTKGIVDLLTPVGPTPTKGIVDLPTPVGPIPTKGIDLPAPVGPVARSFDLPTPVGPIPTKGIDLPAPVGPAPTRGVDIVAPKGFFDESPPPASGNRPRPSELSLDDLDVVPAGEPPSVSRAPLEFPSSATEGSFSMDALTLEAPTEIPAEQPSFGNVDLPEGPAEEAPDVVSFGRPGPATTDALDIAEPLRKRKPGSLAEAPPRRAPRAPARRRAFVIAALIVVALAAAAYYVYSSVELEVFGIMTAPARERHDRAEAGLKAARKLLVADDWHQAATTAERAASADPKRTDLLGIAAQAYLAAAIEQGLDEKADKTRADGLLTKAQAAGEPGTEVKKAQALRLLLDAKPADASKLLLSIGGTDPNLPLYRGWASLAAGDHSGAVIAFTAALQAVPGRVPALYGLGRAQYGAGQKDKAQETFHQLFDKQKHYGAWLALTEIERPPGSPERERELGVLCESASEREKAHPHDLSRAWMLYGREAMTAGRWDQAADRFRKARELWDRNFDAAVGGALVDIELKAAGAAVDLGQARQILAKAVEVDPKRVEALVGLGRISLLENRLADARKAMADAVAADDGYARARYWLGKTFEQLDERDSAAAAYQKSMELAPKDYVAHVALAQLLSADAKKADRDGKHDKAKALNDQVLKVLAPVADAAKSDPKLALTLGNAYMSARDAETAEKWFRAAVTLDGDNVDARLSLAQSLEGQKRLADAATEYAAARDKAPRRDDVALGLAEVYVKLRNAAGADKLFDKLLSGDAPTPRVRAAAARYYVRTGRTDLALAQKKPLEAADPANPAVPFLHGVELMRDKRRDEAVKLLRDATLGASEPEYYNALGEALEVPASLPEALNQYLQASQLDETYFAPILGRARIRIAQRSFGPALQELERAAAIDPQVPDLWNMAGEANAVLSKYDKAVDAYRRSLALKNDPAIHYKLGLTCQAMDNGPCMTEELRKALDGAPANAEWRADAYFQLGIRYQADNRQKDKCAAFTEYLKLAPANDRMHLNEAKRALAGCM
jgi:tetratricopeptide (TPR) repeat protein